MKINTLWVVRNPTPRSILVDVLYRVDSPNELARIVVGTGASLWAEEHTTLYTTEKEALADAKARLAKVRGANSNTV